MEAAFERRGLGGSRIPLDAPVELHHEGFTEAFEADGVNVSSGGLSMRAPYLPDVGARLRCRFRSDNGPVEAGAEVVWSNDKGPQAGEFGLRFVDLDDRTSRVIRSMISGKPYLPPAPGLSRSSAEDTIDQVPELEPVSISIDGVATAVRAGVVSEDDDVLTVAQELPFLRLKTGVSIQRDGRRGRIESIDLMVDGDTPRLLIDIVFDEALEASAASDDAFDPRSLADATIPDFEAQPGAIPEPVARTTTDTAVDLSAPVIAATEPMTTEDVSEGTAKGRAPRIIRVSSSSAGSVRAIDDGDLDDGDLDDAELDDVGMPEAGMRAAMPDLSLRVPESIDEALESIAAATPQTTDSAAATAAAVTTADPTTDDHEAALTQTFAQRAVIKLAAIKVQIAALFVRIAPHVAKLRGKAKDGYGRFRSTLLPRAVGRAKALFSVTKRTAEKMWARVAERVPAIARRARKKRRTAPPPKDSNVTKRSSSGRSRRAEKPRPERNRRRTLAASAVAFVAVALAVWALTPGDETADAESPLAGHQPLVTPGAAAPEVGTTAAQPAELAPGQGAPTAAGAPATVNAPAIEPAMPRAVGAASREAGPMAAPTFPSLSEGARPQAPQALPEGSPYAVDVRDQAAGATANAPTAEAVEGSSFGTAAIEDGRNFLIRMSQPVTVVRGTRRADGFSVTVPNSLSLDRAGPIAASHPLVSRSLILNRGDHAELNITFVEGRSPAYRVSARGSALEVVIARR